MVGKAWLMPRRRLWTKGERVAVSVAEDFLVNNMGASPLNKRGFVVALDVFRQAVTTAFFGRRLGLRKRGFRCRGTGQGHYRRSGCTALRFGFVGGPGSNKGSKQILEAFRSLSRTDYELVIVDAAQNVGRTWRHEIDWSVPGVLRFHPGYTARNIDDFFRSVDVLLFPSLWKESFGLTVREALIRDVWVIASDAGGIAEDCVDGVNATLIPMSTNPAGLKHALERLLDEPVSLDYENPRKGDIVSCDDQARELSEMLTGLLEQDTEVRVVA